MSKTNRIISLLVLICFLFNTAVQDLAFSQQIDFKANIDKLAAPSRLDDLVGIQPKDIGDIRLWFTAYLLSVKHKGLEITVENLQKFNRLPGNTIFQPKGAQFFINEVKEISDGTIKVMVRRKDSKYGQRTYYIEFSPKDGRLDVYPEGKSKERSAKDAKAIERYTEHEEYDKNVIEWMHNPENKNTPIYTPEEIGIDYPALVKEVCDKARLVIDNPDNLLLLEERKVFIAPITEELEAKLRQNRVTLVTQDGKTAKVYAFWHSSNNTVHIFLEEHVIRGLKNGQGVDKEIIKDKLACEIGVMLGCPILKISDISGWPVNEIYERYLQAVGPERAPAILRDLLPTDEKQSLEPKHFSIVNLDTNLIDRDYATGEVTAIPLELGLGDPLLADAVEQSLQAKAWVPIWDKNGFEQLNALHPNDLLSALEKGDIFATTDPDNPGKVMFRSTTVRIPSPDEVLGIIKTKIDLDKAKQSPYFIGMSMGGTKLYAVLYKSIVGGKPEVVDSYSVIWKNAFSLKDEKDVSNLAKVAPDAIVEKIAGAVEGLLGRNKLTIGDLNNIGCTSPGPLDENTGFIGTACKTFNLPFDKYPFVRKLVARLGTPLVEIRHDAHAGVEGEVALGELGAVENGYFIIEGTGLGGSPEVKRIYYKKIPELTEPGHHIVGKPIEGHPYSYEFRFIHKYGKGHPYEVVESPDPEKKYQITLLQAKNLMSREGYIWDDFIWAINGEKDFEDIVAGPGIASTLADKDRLVSQFGGNAKNYTNINKPEDLNRLAIDGNEKAKAIIMYIGEEVGKGVASIIAASYGKEWQLERVVIGSTIGEKLGLGLKTEGGDDFYFHYIRESAREALVKQFKLPEEFASEISKEILRSTITQDERETAGFDRRIVPQGLLARRDEIEKRIGEIWEAEAGALENPFNTRTEEAINAILKLNDELAEKGLAVSPRTYYRISYALLFGSRDWKTVIKYFRRFKDGLEKEDGFNDDSLKWHPLQLYFIASLMNKDALKDIRPDRTILEHLLEKLFGKEAVEELRISESWSTILDMSPLKEFLTVKIPKYRLYKDDFINFYKAIGKDYNEILSGYISSFIFLYSEDEGLDEALGLATNLRAYLEEAYKSISRFNPFEIRRRKNIYERIKIIEKLIGDIQGDMKPTPKVRVRGDKKSQIETVPVSRKQSVTPENALEIIKSPYIQERLKRKGYFTIDDFRSRYNQIKFSSTMIDLPENPDNDLRSRLAIGVLIRSGYLKIVDETEKPVKYMVTEKVADKKTVARQNLALLRTRYLSEESKRDINDNEKSQTNAVFVGMMCADLIHFAKKLIEGMKENSLELAGDIDRSIDPDGSRTKDYIESLSKEVQRSLQDLTKIISGGPASSAARICAQLAGIYQGISFITSVGGDAEPFIEAFKALGIDMEKIYRSGKPTGKTFIFELGEGIRSFLHDVGASADLTIDKLRPDMFEDRKVAEFGGIELSGLMEGLDKSLKMAKDKGSITVFDTVVDKARLWKKFYGGDNLNNVLSLIDVFTPSIDEASQIIADYLNPNDEAKADKIAQEIKGNPEYIVNFFAEHGAKAIFLKAGEDGAYIKIAKDSVFKEGAEFRVPILRGFMPVSGTGTGDAFTGALVYALTHGWDARKAAMFSNVVGGICVQYKGGTIKDETLVDALYYMERLRAQMLAEALVNPETKEEAKELIIQLKKDGFTRLVAQVEKETANCLYLKAFPHTTALPPNDIEMADFGLGNFDDVGLLLEVVSIFNAGEGRGHTGKVLINKPNQLLIEHVHKTIVVLKKGAQLPKGYTDIDKIVKNFEGIREYNPDGSPAGMKYLAKDYRIVLADSDKTQLDEEFKEKYLVEELEGKSETFMAVEGDGVLLTDNATVLYTPGGSDPSNIPQQWKEKIDELRKEQGGNITTNKVIYMKAGTIVLLPKGTKHAFLAGDEGAVYIEFSGPSIDEADDFTDKGVERLPKEIPLKDGEKDLPLKAIMELRSKVKAKEVEPTDEADRAGKNYLNLLLKKGLPLFPKLPLSRIDLNTFNRSDGKDLDAFAKIGQLSYTVVEHTIGEGKGHKGRLIGNLPSQYVPPIAHESSGTFKCIYGASIMFVEGADIIRAPPAFDPYEIPLELEAAFNAAKEKLKLGEELKGLRMIHVVPGMEVRIPLGSRYAFFSGDKGFLSLEFTSPAFRFKAIQTPTHHHKNMALAMDALQENLDIHKVRINNFDDIDSILNALKQLGEKIKLDAPFQTTGISLQFGKIEHLGGHTYLIPASVIRDSTAYAYKLIFSFSKDGYSIVPCTASEYERSKEIIKSYAKNDLLPRRQESDKVAIERYGSINQKIIDKFIRERIEKGEFAEIKSRAEELGWDEKYPDRRRPENYWSGGLLDLMGEGMMGEGINPFLKLFNENLSVEKLFEGKNIVFIRMPLGTDPMVYEDGKPLMVQSHTSENAVYFFLPHDLFDDLAEDFKKLPPVEQDSSVKRLYHDILPRVIHELGVICGLPFTVREGLREGEWKLSNDLDIAYALYYTQYDVGKLQKEYKHLKGLAPIKLDEHLPHRDYLASFGGGGTVTKQLTLIGLLDFISANDLRNFTSRSLLRALRDKGLLSPKARSHPDGLRILLNMAEEKGLLHSTYTWDPRPNRGTTQYDMTKEGIEIAERFKAIESAKREYVIGGNWKGGKITEQEAVDLLKEIARELKGVDAKDLDVVITIAPSDVHISAVSKILRQLEESGEIPRGLIRLGAQDVSAEEPGPRTGETFAEQLKDLGVEYVIIGHSERRRGNEKRPLGERIRETNELVNAKLKRALATGLKPIVCVGENLAEYKLNKTYSVIEKQISESLKGLTEEQAKGIVIAYEPVYAIGTGITATPEQANKVQQFIRFLLYDMFGEEVAKSVRIQYGGSVKPDNITALIAQPNIDGGLIGGASLKAEDFAGIIKAIVTTIRSKAQVEERDEAGRFSEHLGKSPEDAMQIIAELVSKGLLNPDEKFYLKDYLKGYKKVYKELGFRELARKHPRVTPSKDLYKLVRMGYLEEREHSYEDGRLHTYELTDSGKDIVKEINKMKKSTIELLENSQYGQVIDSINKLKRSISFQQKIGDTHPADRRYNPRLAYNYEIILSTICNVIKNTNKGKRYLTKDGYIRLSKEGQYKFYHYPAIRHGKNLEVIIRQGGDVSIFELIQGQPIEWLNFKIEIPSGMSLSEAARQIGEAIKNTKSESGFDLINSAKGASARQGDIISSDEAARDIQRMRIFDDVFEGITGKGALYGIYDKIVDQISRFSQEFDNKYGNESIKTVSINVVPGGRPGDTLVVNVNSEKKERRIGIYQSYIEGIYKLSNLINEKQTGTAYQQEKIILDLILGSVLHEMGHGFEGYSGIDLHSLFTNKEIRDEIAKMLGIEKDQSWNETRYAEVVAETLADLNIGGKGNKYYVPYKSAYLFYKFMAPKPEVYVKQDGTIDREKIYKKVQDYFEKKPYLKNWFPSGVKVDDIALEVAQYYNLFFGRSSRWYKANVSGGVSSVTTKQDEADKKDSENKEIVGLIKTAASKTASKEARDKARHELAARFGRDALNAINKELNNVNRDGVEEKMLKITRGFIQRSLNHRPDGTTAKQGTGDDAAGLEATVDKVIEPAVKKFVEISERRRSKLNRGQRTYGEFFRRTLVPRHLKLYKSLKEAGKIAAIFTGMTGNPGGRKTTTTNALRKMYEEQGIRDVTVISFDDWLKQKSDRPIDDETGETTEEVLKKFKAEEFVRSIKTFIKGEGRSGTELVKPIYDTDAKGQVKVGIDGEGKVIVFNEENLTATVEQDERGQLVLVYREKGKELRRGRSIDMVNIPISIRKGTDEMGEFEIDIKGTTHHFSAYASGERQVMVLDKEGRRIPTMVDYYDKERVLGDTKAVLVKEGHVTESGERVAKPWPAKEFIPYEEGAYIVEGILALYDFPGEKEKLSKLYTDTIFVDCDFDIRLVGGILREKQRVFLDKGREATPQEIKDYVKKFIERQRLEDMVIYATKRGARFKVTSQTGLESLYVLYKKGALTDPKTLAILEEMGIKPYALADTLDSLDIALIKEHLDKLRNKKILPAFKGKAHDVFFLGGGLVMKIPHDEEEFRLSIYPFYNRVLSKIGGGLIAPGIILDVSDYNITCSAEPGGAGRRVRNVLIHTDIEPLKQKSEDPLLRKGTRKEAEAWLVKFFELQQRLWRVGLIDTEPRIGRYGLMIEEGYEIVVIYTVDSLSNDPEKYSIKNYTKTFLESLPEELRGYAKKLISEYAPKTKEEFKRKYFRKGLAQARGWIGVTYPELVTARLEYLAERTLTSEADLLRKMFNGLDLQGLSPQIAWTKLWLETISAPRSLSYKGLDYLYKELLIDKEIISKISMTEMWRKIEEAIGIKIMDMQTRQEIVLFLYYLYNEDISSKKPSEELPARDSYIGSKIPGKKPGDAERGASAKQGDIIQPDGASAKQGTGDDDAGRASDKIRDIQKVGIAFILLEEMVRENRITRSKIDDIFRVTWPIRLVLGISGQRFDETKTPISSLGKSLTLPKKEKAVVSNGIQAWARLVNSDRETAFLYIKRLNDLGDAIEAANMPRIEGGAKSSSATMKRPGKNPVTSKATVELQKKKDRLESELKEWREELNEKTKGTKISESEIDRWIRLGTESYGKRRELISIKLNINRIIKEIEKIDVKIKRIRSTAKLEKVYETIVDEIRKQGWLTDQGRFKIVLAMLNAKDVKSQYPELAGELEKLQNLIGKKDEEIIKGIEKLTYLSRIKKDILRLAFIAPIPSGAESYDAAKKAGQETLIAKITTSEATAIADEIAAMKRTHAKEAGLTIEKDPRSPYNFLLPTEFFANNEFKEHLSKYGDRFNLNSVSGITTSPESFVANLLAKIKAGEENKTVALVPCGESGLSEAQIKLLTDKGIRVVPIRFGDLTGLKSKDKSNRAQFQEETYAIMRLFRFIDEETLKKSPSAYISLSTYLKTHFGFSGEVALDNYIQAIATNRVSELIKGYLIYKPIIPRDAQKDYEEATRSLIFA